VPTPSLYALYLCAVDPPRPSSWSAAIADLLSSGDLPPHWPPSPPPSAPTPSRSARPYPGPPRRHRHLRAAGGARGGERGGRAAARGRCRRDREVEAGWRRRLDLCDGIYSIFKWVPQIDGGGPSIEGMERDF
jgi:hypothetical protein